MTKHTPGKWEVKKGIQTYSIRTVENISICKHRKPIQKSIAMVSHYSLNAFANARLIASAPELLEACKICLDFINIHHSGTHLRDVLQQAIAKAEGLSKNV